jgi:hypothetical protein
MKSVNSWEVPPKAGAMNCAPTFRSETLQGSLEYKTVLMCHPE